METNQFDELHTTIYENTKKLEHLLENKRAKYEHRSFELNELLSALAKAQGEFETAGLTNSNPFFKSKYADLAEIVRASRPALSKHGLSVIQYLDINQENKQLLISVLGHTSGQWISSQMVLNPSKNDVQALGSCITYCRRYSYAALVGVVVCDEDDDGNQATHTQKPLINEDDARFIEHSLKDHAEISTKWLHALGVKNWYQLPDNKVHMVMEKIKTLPK